ncbi:MAG: YceI family protein [Methylococcaceae bacterium]
MKMYLLMALVLFAGIADAEWVIDNSKSNLFFISVKNNSKGEVHTFKTLKGKLGEDGSASLTIDLTSVETQVAIRNDRLQKFLFEVAKFPEAIISLNVDPQKVKALLPGEMTKLSVLANLNLHDSKEPIKTELVVTAMNDGSLIVSTLQPLLLSAENFKLVAGIDKLKALVKLDMIDKVIPVTFNLLFSKEPEK